MSLNNPSITVSGQTSHHPKAKENNLNCAALQNPLGMSQITPVHQTSVVLDSKLISKANDPQRVHGILGNQAMNYGINKSSGSLAHRHTISTHTAVANQMAQCSSQSQGSYNTLRQPSLIKHSKSSQQQAQYSIRQQNNTKLLPHHAQSSNPTVAVEKNQKKPTDSVSARAVTTVAHGVPLQEVYLNDNGKHSFQVQRPTSSKSSKTNAL
jgi:hypothetical protein